MNVFLKENLILNSNRLYRLWKTTHKSRLNKELVVNQVEKNISHFLNIDFNDRVMGINMIKNNLEVIHPFILSFRIFILALFAKLPHFFQILINYPGMIRVEIPEKRRLSPFL